MEYGFAVLVFIGTFIASYFIVQTIRSRFSKPSQRLPPSLPSLPLIGSVYALPDFSEWHRFFMKKSEELGSVFGFQLFSKYTIVLNSREAINEALVKHSSDFANRPGLRLNAEGFNPHFKGIIDHEFDATFRKQHQTVLSILKEFGFGRDIMETRILREVSSFVKHVRELNGSPFWPDSIVSSSVLNVILSIVVGRSTELSTTEHLVKLVHSYVIGFSDIFGIEIFPPSRFLPGRRGVLEKVLADKKQIFDIIEECLRSCSKGSFIQHYIDREGSEFDSEQLSFIIRDLILAGTETSASALIWSMYLLANHPDIQAKMHQEIDSVLPRNELPRLATKSHLPYVEATLHEIMRIKTLVPLALFHETTCDTTVGGYFIPAKTNVLCNLYAVHNDPTVWTDPTEFRPERFLDEAGQVTGKDRIIPFSLGRRSCLGELLARQEFFLFLAGLVQNFVIKPPEGKTSVECKENYVATLSPSPFDVCLIPRA